MGRCSTYGFPVYADRVVLLGNHRDAIAYGALDPGSGTAVMLEVARAFAVLAQQGEAPPLPPPARRPCHGQQHTLGSQTNRRKRKGMGLCSVIVYSL